MGLSPKIDAILKTPQRLIGQTPLRIGGYRYEHTRALFDGQVSIAGQSATFESAPLVTDTFRTMLEGGYDVAELGLTYFLRSFETQNPPLLALPIFPNRSFRHSAIFVNADSGIDRPETLAGRRIGEFSLYGHDAGVWAKGIFSDEFGLDPAGSSWVIGGTNHADRPIDWIPQTVPDGVEVNHAPEGATLAELLETGEIDALVSADVPRAFLDDPGTRIRRLIPDYESVERDYYARTGIFPPMHVIAVRRELAEDTDLLRALYNAYEEAKQTVQQAWLENATKQHMAVPMPWFSELFAENRALLGEDWWPYGLERNRTALDTFLRYHHEQGLSSRRLTCEEILAPGLLDT